MAYVVSHTSYRSKSNYVKFYEVGTSQDNKHRLLINSLQKCCKKNFIFNMIYVCFADLHSKIIARGYASVCND